MGRQESAKLLFAGSIPARVSMKLKFNVKSDKQIFLSWLAVGISLLALAVLLFGGKETKNPPPRQVVEGVEEKLEKSDQVESLYGWTNHCPASFGVSDQNGDGSEERVFICDDRIILYFAGCPTCADGPNDALPHILETKDEFLGLFEYAKAKPALEIVEYDAPLLGTIVKIHPTNCHITSCPFATSLHLVQGQQVRRIFKLDEDGRWGSLKILNFNPLTIETNFSLGSLGCGSCAIEWRNYYQWDFDTNQFELVNDRFGYKYVNLYEMYVDTDNMGCGPDEGAYSEFWMERKDEEYFCGDKAPYVGTNSVDEFLQAKLRIERIMDGENLDHEDYVSLLELEKDEVEQGSST